MMLEEHYLPCNKYGNDILEPVSTADTEDQDAADDIEDEEETELPSHGSNDITPNNVDETENKKSSVDDFLKDL